MTTTKLSDLAKRVRCESQYGKVSIPQDQLDDWQRQAHQYRVTLRYKRRRMSLDYFMGSALTSEPDSASVLSSLLLDASALDESFENWCADYGYDTDSRKAERLYKLCCKQGEKLKQLLGDDYDDFRNAENDI